MLQHGLRELLDEEGQPLVVLAHRGDGVDGIVDEREDVAQQLERFGSLVAYAGRECRLHVGFRRGNRQYDVGFFLAHLQGAQRRVD